MPARTRSSRSVQLLLVVAGLNVLFLIKYSADVPISLRFIYRDDTRLSAADKSVQSTSLRNSTSTDTASVTGQPSQRIKQIRLLGERHSGTTYLTRYLQGCFSKRHVVDFLVRKKHWFQPSSASILRAAKLVDRNAYAEATDLPRFDPEYKTWWDIAQDAYPKSFFGNSLVLYVVRDPYQWMEAMRQRPWHWPNHLTIFPKNQTTISTMKYRPEKEGARRNRRLAPQNDPKRGRSDDIFPGAVRVQKSFVDHIALNWDQFVRTPMRLLDEDTSSSSSLKLCQKGFPKGSISPCVQNHTYVPASLSHIPIAFLRHLPFSVQDAVYELQLNGQPFEHPLALRAAKIRNLLRLEQAWNLGGFRLLRYEEMLGGTDNGTNLRQLVEQIEQFLGVNSTCKPHKVIPKTPYELPQEFLDWIIEHGDWEVEGRLGYTQINGTTQPPREGV